MNKIHHQIIIIGAGIAGLWSFNVLKCKGYDVILLEKDSIGGTQSLASQGMIHGGQRYALQGALSNHSESISAMPGIWDQALKGEITPDLSSANILSDKQYMWSPGGLTSNVTSFFASKAMNSRVDSLPKEDWPQIFKDHLKFKGKIYQLDEVVLDIKSVATALSKNYLEHIIKIDQLELNVKNEKLESIVITQGSQNLEITADQFIFTAGIGNEEIAALLWPDKKPTQRRPLKQILIDDVEYPLYAHCITVDPRPRVTVSAHPKENGKYTWYLGGLVAVKHIEDSDQQAID
ncbi:MAG: FAD-dependent oxidoreductase, partial [Candidatus Paceibacterota bacterium]